MKYSLDRHGVIVSPYFPQVAGRGGHQSRLAAQAYEEARQLDELDETLVHPVGQEPQLLQRRARRPPDGNGRHLTDVSRRDAGRLLESDGQAPVSTEGNQQASPGDRDERWQRPGEGGVADGAAGVCRERPIGQHTRQSPAEAAGARKLGTYDRPRATTDNAARRATHHEERTRQRGSSGGNSTAQRG